MEAVIHGIKSIEISSIRTRKLDSGRKFYTRDLIFHCVNGKGMETKDEILLFSDDKKGLKL